MRKMILVGLLAFAVALTGTAYAEVQSVKVSGDIDMKAIIHQNYDLKVKQTNLNEPGGTTGQGAGGISDDDDANFFLSTTRVRVDADLTDNVSTSVRLLNQRIWGDGTTTVGGAGADINQINIDNAYVVLKEFLYSPLTVIAGRQDLKYGTGFIVGAGLLGDPAGVFTNIASGSQTQIGEEYSAYNAYDAIRFILDFAPWTIEGVLAKISETGTTTNDQDLYGALINYKFDRWGAEVEPYCFVKNDEGASVTVNDSFANGAQRTYETNRVQTVGIRGAATPIEHLQVNLEGAHQWGQLIDTTSAAVQKRQRNAWGGTADARYTWANVRWTPVTGIGTVYFSGEQPTSETGVKGATGTSPDTNEGDRFNAWDSMYRGSFTTFIQDFLAGRDAQAGNATYTTFDRNDTAATTNRVLLYGDLALKPLEDLTLWGRYTHAWFAKAPRTGRSHNAGDEIDAKLIYAYTDDVSLALFGGWFIPGTYYSEPDSNNRGNQLAWTTGGSASVKF